MHSHKHEHDAQQIGELFHKEKEPKRNLKVKRSKALSLKERIPDVSRPNITEVGKKVRSKEQHKSLTSRASAAKNARIDEYLFDLLMRELIDEEYWKFHTKCMHVLGIEKYNQLVVESVDGKNPKHLLAYKLKGALEFDAKKKQYGAKYELQ